MRFDYLEPGIKELVTTFVNAKSSSTTKPSIEERRKSYINSKVLAGISESVHEVINKQFDHFSLTIFKPSNQSNLPIVIYYHGGCFISGSAETHDQQLRKLANLANALVVAVNYRLAPEHTYPAAHNDAYNAAQLIYEQGHLWGGNTEDITLVGDSAGGQIALITSLRLRDQANWMPTRQVLIYPMLDATASSNSYIQNGEDYIITKDTLISGFTMYLGDTHISLKHPEISPLFRDDFSGLQETHIISAEFDPLLNECEQLYHKLLKAKVPVYCQRYLGVIHGFFQLSGISGAAKQALKQVASIIKG
ncbi:alpha/beta hydrolase [Zooshikella sp. RANM57]|uniref:alpha/beta hydrolase n=1 Tax=Zooshikella sp. RANM57 TaxID=3425863 RepID=UPI003D6F0498